MLPQVDVGDHVTLRKQHPCGSYDWVVTRIGTDIGLKCLSCGRRVMLPRGEFNKRVKRIQHPGDDESPASPGRP